MKQADIIRLGIIAIAMIFGYLAILNFINFICALPDFYPLDGKLSLAFILKAICCAAACWVLIKYNRKLATLIEEQK